VLEFSLLNRTFVPAISAVAINLFSAPGDTSWAFLIAG
jgi:hypothetical protein